MPLFDWQGLVRRFLTALNSSVAPGQAAPLGTPGTATPGTATAEPSPQEPQEGPGPQDPGSRPTTVHDLFALGMKDREQAETLKDLLDSEYHRDRRTRDQELIGFLAKCGCLTLCVALLLGSLVVSLHLAKGMGPQISVPPAAHVVLVSLGSALLTGTVGWLIRRLRSPGAPSGRTPGRTGAAGLNDRTRSDGRSGDGSANPSGGRQNDAPPRNS
jgi:hypothetical protein